MVQQISIADYNYDLPEERIAKYPLPDRASSRLLCYEKASIRQSLFSQLPQLLPEDSLLIRNNSKVIQARLHFSKPTGATVEVFCLEPLDPTSYELALQSRGVCLWQCMLGNAKRWRVGDSPLLVQRPNNTTPCPELRAERLAHDVVRFSWTNSNYTFAELLECLGVLPIPPYLNRDTEEQDKKSYQTIYAKPEGSVAAPTAGLHFTPEIFEELSTRGITTEDITLHVGAGTFLPVKTEHIGAHQMHREFVSIDKALIQKLKDSRHSLIAVGTTSVRSMESLYHLARKLKKKPETPPESLELGQWEAYKDADEDPNFCPYTSLLHYMAIHQLKSLCFSTAILIAPGYKFRVIKGLITNFHQPRSTLLLLIAAFVGSDWKRIYNYALDEGFRFLSYGDSSLLLP